jgi:beta-lactamase class C
MIGTKPAADPAAVIDRVIDQYRVDEYPPAVSVAFYQRGNVPVELTIAKGKANKETNLAATPDTIFELGSVTKVFTSTLLGFSPDMLDEPLSKHLPVRVSNPQLDAVKLKYLATHTSGFPRNAPGKEGSGGQYLFNDKMPPEDSELVSLWSNWKPDSPGNPCAPCDVGTCWQYSNVGFVTLGYAVAGLDYNTELRDKVTDPLGMKATGAIIPDGAAVALGYLKDGCSATVTAADLKSSGADMLTWIKANLGALKMPDSLGAALGETHKTWFKKSQQCSKVPAIRFDMGLAWQIHTLGKSSYMMWIKDGESGSGDQSCWMGFIPEKQIGVAVLTNGVCPERPPAWAGTQILEQVLGA